MKLTDGLYPAIERFIIYDKKCSSTRDNLNTLRSRYRMLVKCMRGMDFNRDNFTICVQEMKESGYSDQSINNFIKLAKHIDRLYKINELQDYTYFAKTYTPKVVLKFEEIEKMAELDIEYDRDRELKNKRYRAVILTLFYTGARINEVLHLKWSDMTSENVPCVILNQTKIKELRYAPIPEFLYEEILHLPRYGDYIFAVTTGHCVTRQTVSIDLKRRAEELGITKKVHNHIIRHSFVNFMLRSGAKMEQVQMMVGHKSIETTQKYYYHTMVEELSQTLYAYHPSLKKMQTKEIIEKKAHDLLNALVDLTRFKYDLVIKELHASPLSA